MQRKASRASISKQELMGDYNPLQSPGLFKGFTSKICSDSESMMSPTSILDKNSFSGFINPFWSDTTSSSPKNPKPERKISWDKLDSRGVGVGLGLVDVLSEEFNSDSKVEKNDSRMVLFGSQLKIQIPPLPPSVVSPAASPRSPPEFGIKTRNSYVSCPFSPGLSLSSLKKSPGSTNSGMDNANSPRVFSPFSPSEMELSEEYTCVKSHGLNPRTTHIFDDCIVESCCGASRFSGSRKQIRFPVNTTVSYPSENFLSFCCYCKKSLGQGNDIYMYRGEKAFCSSDCRYREMMLEEGIETPEFDDIYGTPP